jgi:hypothetical protein
MCRRRCDHPVLHRPGVADHRDPVTTSHLARSNPGSTGLGAPSLLGTIKETLRGDGHDSHHREARGQQEARARRLVVTATVKGSLLGVPADGKPVRWDAVDIYRVTDGKISEEWAADDIAAIMAQIGAFNPPWAA